MSEKLPTIYLGRHGETAWSLSGQDTGLTNLPLTERGERNAQRLGDRPREFIDAMGRMENTRVAAQLRLPETPCAVVRYAVTASQMLAV